jgi:hypothetical protein
MPTPSSTTWDKLRDIELRNGVIAVSGGIGRPADESATNVPAGATQFASGAKDRSRALHRRLRDLIVKHRIAPRGNASASSPLRYEAISRNAQELWEKYGRPTGRDEEIWLEAERKLENQRTAPAASTGRKPRERAYSRERI